jgi:anti-anti-sigma regulatory factor
MRLQIPTINDDIGDYQQLFALWSQVIASDDSEIVYDFSACRFFRQSGVAFMLGLARLAQQRGKQVTVEGLHEKIEYNMRMNGFLASFRSARLADEQIGDSMP